MDADQNPPPRPVRPLPKGQGSSDPDPIVIRIDPNESGPPSPPPILRPNHGARGPVRPGSAVPPPPADPFRATPRAEESSTSPRPPHRPAAAASAAAAQRSTDAPRDDAVLCATCGYDLRGSLARPTCPECGAVLPKRRRVPMTRADQNQLRAEVVRHWASLGFLALAPIPLLSPIPCLSSCGIVASVALAMAPGFRLAAIRNLDILPNELRDAVRPQTARFRQTQYVEGTFAILICVYAALGTFAFIPAKFALLYRALILAWWCVACAGLVAQLQYGDALLAKAGTDPADAADLSRSARWRVRVAFVVAVCGAVATALGWTLPRGDLASVIEVSGLLALGVASVIFIFAALRIRSHAELVGEGLYESDALAKRVVATEVAVERAESDLGLPPEWKPPPPPPKPPEDDAPIPLA